MQRQLLPIGVGRSPRQRREAASAAPRQGRAGQALPEFALVLPVFMLLFLGAVDFGRVFFSYIAVRNAASQGAAYGAASPTDGAGIASRVQQETNTQRQAGESTLNVTTACVDGNSGATIDCSLAQGGFGAGNLITVSVSERFTFLTPFINNVFGNSFSLGASATAAVLGLAPGPDASQPPGCTAPSAAFTYTLSGPYGISLDGSSSTPGSGQWAVASYLWDMGDGANPNPPVTGKTASYTYATSGTDATYPVTLTVQNQCGSSTTMQSVVIGPAASATPSPSPTPTPTPSPSASALPSCNTTPTFTYSESGHSGKFTFQGAYSGQPGPASWSWNFGDSQTGSGQNVSHTYAGSSGTKYTVTLTVRDSSGTCVRTFQTQVSV